MAQDIIFFGIQGSGKGTQAQLLLEKMSDRFSYFSSGDLFRALTSSSNAIGNYVKDRIHAGTLIDDKVTNALFASYLYTVIDDNKYMLLDGYPRTQQQMELMMDMLQEQGRSIKGIQFSIPDEVALDRMRGRGRTDDTEEAMLYRIAQFYDNTQPTIDRFAEHAELIQIDATRSIEEIQEDVVNVVK